MHSRSETTIDYNDTYRGYKYKYLITIAKHQVKDYVGQEDLDLVHAILKSRLTDLYIPYWAYEVSLRYGQLHMHGVALTRRPVFYKEHNSILGFRVQWSKIYNLKRAIDYVYKDANNKDMQMQILNENYYRYNYGFA